MSRCKNNFQEDWLKTKDANGDELSEYIVKDKNGEKHHAFCTACNKSIYVGNMGKSALLQHATSSTHKEKMKIRKGVSRQSQLPFRRVDPPVQPNDPDDPNDEEVEVAAQSGDPVSRPSTSSGFSISVAKDPVNLTESLSVQGCHFQCLAMHDYWLGQHLILAQSIYKCASFSMAKSLFFNLAKVNEYWLGQYWILAQSIRHKNCFWQG